jgi:hypothetical protein
MICELSSKNYNRIFTELIHEAQKKNDFSLSTIRGYLLKQTAETSRWPEEDEFKEAWLELPFYSRLKRSKTRLVLEAIERELYKEKTEMVDIQKALTIEHLMPQGWEEYWPLTYDQSVMGAKEKAETERRHTLHRIGNLTLLTKQLNPAISNSGWKQKRPEILGFSALNLNRYFLNKEDWNEENIAVRTEELFDIAKKIWARPPRVTIEQGNSG